MIKRFLGCWRPVCSRLCPCSPRLLIATYAVGRAASAVEVAGPRGRSPWQRQDYARSEEHEWISKRELAIAVAVTTTSIVIDWPRALVGLALGAISQYLPYCTFVIPVGSAIIAAVGEVLYLAIGRTAAHSLGSFLIGVFSVFGTATSLHVTIRNLKDRL